jgi:hypothetical protein
MRRYCRYKICKSNFHFFFYSSRLLKFNRPKWNVVKEKIEKLKKTKNVKKINLYKIKFPRFFLGSLYNISFMFKCLKDYKQNSLRNIRVSGGVTHRSMYLNCSPFNNSSFDYLFYN